MKKLICLTIMIVTVLLVSGCSSSYIRLTEDEKNAIAQYSAYLLLKYDENHIVKEKLLDPKDLEDAKKAALSEEPAEESVLETVEVTPEASPTPEPTPTPVPETEEETQAPAEQVPPENEVVEASDKTVRQIAQAISECYDDPSFEITYRNYEVCDTYKSIYEYFSISAPDSVKLLILNFDIKNVSEKNQTFNFSEHKVNFSLACDSETVIEPRISLLANDLQFLNQDIAAGETVDAVLLFYIDRIYQSIELQVLGTEMNESSNEKTYQIKIN